MIRKGSRDQGITRNRWGKLKKQQPLLVPIGTAHHHQRWQIKVDLKS